MEKTQAAESLGTLPTTQVPGCQALEPVAHVQIFLKFHTVIVLTTAKGENEDSDFRMQEKPLHHKGSLQNQ